MYRFARTAFTDAVKKQQEKHGSRRQYQRMEQAADVADTLGEFEKEFLESRDHFYMASTGETGWPYVQHRGGPAGFVKVLDDRTIAFADFAGNKQYISVGNLTKDNRVALLFMDYARQARLKILARVDVVEDDAALLAKLALPGYKAKVERAMVARIEAFDWNCPQHITPRFTAQEIAENRVK